MGRRKEVSFTELGFQNATWWGARTGASWLGWLETFWTAMLTTIWCFNFDSPSSTTLVMEDSWKMYIYIYKYISIFVLIFFWVFPWWTKIGICILSYLYIYIHIQQSTVQITGWVDILFLQFFPEQFGRGRVSRWGGNKNNSNFLSKTAKLGGGFKYFWFSPLPGEMIQFD